MVADYRKVSRRRLYNRKWEALRNAHLGKHPLCKRCEKQGRVVAAAVVHHIEPHRGDWAKLYDPNNLESLCKWHHDSEAQREEKAAERAGYDMQGLPQDGSW